MNKNSKAYLYAIIFIVLILGIFYYFPVGFGDGEVEVEGKKGVDSQDSILWTRTANTETLKNNDGTYTKVLHTGTKFIDDHSRRFPVYNIPIENATSLKGVWDIIYLENDTDFILDVIDFNLTSITLNFSADDKHTNKSIPIKVWKKNSEKEEKYLDDVRKGKTKEKKLKDRYKETYDKVKDKKIKVKDKDKKIKKTYDFGLDSILEFGFNSTTVILDDPRLNVKADLLVYNDVTWNHATLMKWALNGSTPSLPQNVTVVNADLCLYLVDKVGTMDNDVKVCQVTTYGMSETLIIPFFRCDLFSNSLTTTISSTTPSTWSCMNVTHIISAWDGVNELGIRIEDPDYLVDEGSDNDHYTDNVVNSFGQIDGSPSLDFENRENDQGTGNTPFLNITYIPGISITTPTPSQIFTEDEPTTYFNITTEVAMDSCHWSEDAGVTNYSMTNYSAFNWTLSNTSMVDGSHTIIYSCNQSSDGSWVDSESVSFDVDSVNVTVCRDLSVSRNYSLLNTISTTESNVNCFDIKNHSILFNMNNYLVQIPGAGGGLGERGVKINSYDNLTLYNVNTQRFENGIQIVNSDNFNLTNIKISLPHDNGLSISTSDNGIVNNLSIDGSTFGDLIYVFSSDNNNFTNFNLFGGSEINTKYGIINFNGADNNIFRDGNISNLGDEHIRLRTSALFINVTFIDSDIDAGKSLTRKWYFSPQVNYTHNGTAVNDANITAYSSGLIKNTEQTDINGQIDLNMELIEYVNNGGTKSYYTNYTFNATFPNWNTDSQIINLTTNYLNQQFNITDETPPTTTATPTSPPGGASYTFTDWTNQNVEVTMIATDSGSGVDTLSFPLYCTDTANTCNPTTLYSGGVTISTEGVSYIRYYSNDTIGNMEPTKSGEMKIDTTPPNLTITNPTNNTNSSNNQLNINYTTIDGGSGLSTCWYTNDTNTANTTLTDCTTNITDIVWIDGNHNVTIWVNDSVNNVNSSIIFFTIDTTNPLINITEPTNNTTHSDNTLDIKYTFTEINPNTCWYTNDTGATNTTLASCGTNITSIVWSEGNHNATIWINDTANNVNSSTVNFFIDSIFPEINITQPLNLSNTTNTQISINYTFTEINPSTCWWNVNGGTNTTLASCGTNITGNTWAEGLNNITIYINDTLNQVNSSFVQFRLDTTPPNVNIVFPVDLASYSITTLSLNYTASDLGVGLDTCWYSNHTDANITIACGTNTTISQAIDGTYDVLVCANDTLGNEACDKNSYTISTTAPAISLIKPTNTKILNNQVTLFNYTAVDANGVDTCQLWGNWTGVWHLNQSNIHGGDTSVDASEGNFTQTIADGFYKWNIWCNDTNPTADFSTTNFTFTIDSVFPLIEYDSSTPNNNTNSTDTKIFVNTTITELNPVNITFELHNQTELINTTTFSMSDQTSNTSLTFVDLMDDTYIYNVTICDIASNCNTTETRLIRLDDTKPILTILNPLAQNYGNNNSMTLNYTTTDNLIGLDNCRYYILNSSSDIVKSEETLSSCENDTFTLPGGDIDYTLHLFSKDILGNQETKSVTFGIRTISPVVVLMINDTQVKNLTNNYFNFSVTTNADSISKCELWGNFNGTFSLNQTTLTPSESTTISFDPINLTEGSFQWNVNCTDNLDNSGFALNNHTYVTDITIPTINITDIDTTPGQPTFTFDSTTTDTNSLTCKYSIYDSTGAIDGLSENVSYTCNTQASPSVTAFGIYNLTIYSKDKAGNENQTTEQFTVATASIILGGGGVSLITGGFLQSLAAQNFSVTNPQGGNTLDLVLAKDSIKPRSKEFLITNTGIESIVLELVCDSTDLDVNQSENVVSGIDICDFVSFEENILTISPNEDDPTRGKFFVLTPPNATIGDKSSFNILALRKVSSNETVRFSKLSVTSRLPIWALVLKYSHIPGQNLFNVAEEEKIIYPVAPPSIFLATIIFITTIFFTQKRFLISGFIGAVILWLLVSIGFIIIL